MIDNFTEAYNWRSAKCWLENLLKQDDIPALSTRIKQIETEILETIKDLAVYYSWSNCFARLTDTHCKHMEAWRQSIKKIRKGTGKHANKHRLDAKYHLGFCKDAIPAWVMPLYRVFETITPESKMFDVVIVDEASQCGFEGIPLYYLAKKILVVGDDKQITPEAVGIPLDIVNRLKQEYLYDFEYASSSLPDNSLFEHAKLRSGKNMITLREHFRCMPEIIKFSNDLCYAETPLIPLRQYTSNRLIPLEHVFVENGYREGSGNSVVNPPEATAICNNVIHESRSKMCFLLLPLAQLLACNHGPERICLECLNEQANLPRRHRTKAQTIPVIQLFRGEGYKDFDPQILCEHIKQSMPEASPEERLAEAQRIIQVFDEARADTTLRNYHSSGEQNYKHSSTQVFVNDYITRCGKNYTNVIEEIQNPDSQYILPSWKFLRDNPIVSMSTSMTFKYIPISNDWYFNDNYELVNEDGEVIPYLGQIRSVVIPVQDLESGDILHFNEDLMKGRQLRGSPKMKNHEVGFFGYIDSQYAISDLLVNAPSVESEDGENCSNLEEFQNIWRLTSRKAKSRARDIINSVDNDQETRKIFEKLLSELNVSRDYQNVAAKQKNVKLDCFKKTYNIQNNTLYEE